jgi:SAM-dependent methyltransferase
MRRWEYAKAITETGVGVGNVVLDAGGAHTVFSYELARLGATCFSVDLDERKVYLGEKAAKKLGLKIHHSVQDLRSLGFSNDTFDYVFCICVIEHIPYYDQPKALRELARVLKPGGILVVSFDFGWAAADYPIFTPLEVVDRIVIPTGLSLGNQRFVLESTGNVNLRHTFGMVFLIKRKGVHSSYEKLREINRHPSVMTAPMRINLALAKLPLSVRFKIVSLMKRGSKHLPPWLKRGYQ